MELLKTIIKFLTYFAVIFTLIEFYLKINKIWKRRADPEVAASQSLIALCIGAFTSLIWVSNYLLSRDWEGVSEYSIFLIETVILMTIGTGLFVKFSGNEKLSLWSLIKKSLKTEKAEAAYLLNSLIKPKNCDLILRILYNIALVDNEYADKEKKLIEAFAMEWDLDIKEIYEFNLKSKCKYSQIREDLIQFLQLVPPNDQVAQFRDLVNLLVGADETISTEEQILLDEILPMLDSYLNNSKKATKYLVIVVPQTAEQIEKTNAITTKSETIHSAGGVAYEVESYNSKMFAEIMCEKYRATGLFTTVLDYDSTKT